MTRIAVAGAMTICVSRPVEGFPVPLATGKVDNGGITVAPASTGWLVARTLQELGDEVVFATYVGRDPLGALAIGALRGKGLHGPTTLRCATQPRAVVLYDPDGNRAGVSDLRSTPRLRYPADRFGAATADADFAVLTNIEFTRSLIPLAVERGLPFATDLHVVSSIDSDHNRPWMADAHVLVCSHEGLPGSAADWVKQVWHRFGTPVVLVGCGADGALVGVREGHAIWQVRPSTPRGVRYQNGAGDTLLGSFVHHYVASGDAVSAARHAVLTAGWYIGAAPQRSRSVSAARLARLRATHGLPGVVRFG
ncbi:MAG TPA: carbohydrate kinase family protein [Pseudonocardiaceae bacterium]|jgi:sugar/nucleoside kinase (ribokinase family)|nr:carbohydrate kinase family protein [Pseudonocardiaceae bacterium]